MFFNKSNLTSLSDLPKNAKIHVIGVCGVAMAQIAIELANRGFIVSGSDKEFYDPMGSLLRESQILCKKGYQADNIPEDCALAVIGNAVTRDNPEVLEIEKRQFAYTIFPQLLFNLLIQNKTSIVVSGTHGKTTTTAMLAYVLDRLALEPSYFFGGKAIQIPNGLKLGNGQLTVVEGDEYDSAFFAKFAKFQFYKPDILIISSIEFDHGDIYQNVEQIQEQFMQMINEMPEGAAIIGCFDDYGVRQLFSEISRKDLKLISFGESDDVSVKLSFVKSAQQLTSVYFIDLAANNRQISLAIPGKFNLKNATACFLAMQVAGMNYSESWNEAFASFLGVARRQQVWLEQPIKLIEDFAHHPTAVTQTLEALKEWNPNRRLVAIFEPRSVTSRKKLFEADYAKALSVADLIILKQVEARGLDNPEELLDVSSVCQQLEQQFGKKALACIEIEDIENNIKNLVQIEDLVVVMSNGSFGGLINKLKDLFESLALKR